MEDNLAVLAQKGNQEAMARLLYDNYEFVFKYLIKFTLNRNVAEELTQETMVRAIEKIDMYRHEKAKFSTWLITIAQNIFFDSIRKKKREQKYIEEDKQILDLYDEPGERNDLWDHALEALGHLPEESRFPVILKHYYGYSLEEVAGIMSIPIGTVKSRIHNGLKAIRKELE